MHSAGYGPLCLRLYLQLSKIKQKEFFHRACRAISSRKLVPGDVIVVLPGKATCDMVLLQGNCLVEESVLSGEVPAHLKPGHTVVVGSVATGWLCCVSVRSTAHSEASALLPQIQPSATLHGKKC